MPDQSPNAAPEATQGEMMRTLREQSERNAYLEQVVRQQQAVGAGAQSQQPQKPVEDSLQRYARESVGMQPEEQFNALNQGVNQRASYFANRAKEEVRQELRQEFAAKQAYVEQQRAIEKAANAIPDLTKDDVQGKFVGAYKRAEYELGKQGLSVAPDVVTDRAIRIMKSEGIRVAPGYMEGSSRPDAGNEYSNQPQEPTEFTAMERLYGMNKIPGKKPGSITPVDFDKEEEGAHDYVTALNGKQRKRGMEFFHIDSRGE